MMIVVIAYIVNLLAPIINTMGPIGVCACVVYEDLYVLLIAGAVAIVGAIFGSRAFKNDIPPRWFWAKSKNELFSFSVSAILGYAISFAMWPCAIYLISTLIQRVSQG